MNSAYGKNRFPSDRATARVSYAAAYYDAVDRPTAQVDVGTNGGAAYPRPITAPAPSDTVLVTSESYNAAGWQSSVTDPRGIVNVSNYDNLGRTVQTIEDYTNGTPTANSDKTTNFTYDGDKNLLTYSAVEPGGQAQTTQYFYGVSPGAGSDITSNDMLLYVQYPNKTTGQPNGGPVDSYSVNALGETKSFIDRNGNTHVYTYDILGRLVSDAVPTLGAGIDAAVRRIEIAYDTGGRPYLYTSFNQASGGSIVNQVQQSYNGLGQLTAEYQSHAGAVNTATTPSVQYTYSEMNGSQNNSRLLSMTYPNGRTLYFNYTNPVDGAISRLSSISDLSAVLETYKYLGLDTLVERDHPQSNVNLTYISPSGGTGDAGDKYTGLDRFGRVVEQNWVYATTGVSTDRFQYSYDRDSNRLARINAVNSAFSEQYSYDQLNQLTNFSRGAASESWTLDALGNWSSVTTNGTTQTRTVNQQNQVTAIGTQSLAYDPNGNTVIDNQAQTLTYDAWNRLVKVTNTSGQTRGQYSYDALGRRIVGTNGGDLYYSAAWQVVEERQGGQVTAQYVWSPVYIDALIERDNNSDGHGNLTQRLYVQQDANWNVTSLVATSGNVQERYIYDPYGQITILNGTWTQQSFSAFGWTYYFQGGRFDSLTGLYNFRNRDYSPTLGRWMQIDPLAFAAGDANLYRVGAGVPTEATDPTGLEGAGFWDSLRFAITNPWKTTKIVVGSVVGDIYHGGKALVTGEAGAALGDRAIAIVERSTGSRYQGTAGQNLSIAKEMGLELIGVNGMAEGIGGADKATGQELSGSERIQRGANGLGAYAGTAAGAAGLVSKAAPTTNLVVTSRGVQVLEKGVPTFSKLPGSGLTGRAAECIRRAPTRQSLINELAQGGVKHTPENIVAIAKDASGKVVYLEKGGAKAGLQHIVQEHGAQFAQQGIAEAQIPDAVMAAVTRGKQVGMQGTRPIFEVEFNGKLHRIAVEVGSNGFIVGANPKSLP